MTETTRQIQLTARPSGLPTPADFRTVEVELPDPGRGPGPGAQHGALGRPLHARADERPASYTPPFALDAPLDGGAVGVVEESTDESVPTGDDGAAHGRLARAAVLPAGQVRPVDTDARPRQRLPRRARHARPDGVRRADPDRRAQGGRHRLRLGRRRGGRLGRRPAGPAARRRRVVGSAGSPEKVAWLTDELGFDAAFDYHDGPVGRSCAAHAPVDVYFDNVGGDHLEARPRRTWPTTAGSRPAAPSPTTTRREPPPGPRNLTDDGHQAADDARVHRQRPRRRSPPSSTGRRGAWVADGSLTLRETFVDGLDHAGRGLPGALPRRQHRQDAGPALSPGRPGSGGAPAVVDPHLGWST